MTNKLNSVEKLINKAVDESNATCAMQYTQAALNAANALHILNSLPNRITQKSTS